MLAGCNWKNGVFSSYLMTSSIFIAGVDIICLLFLNLYIVSGEYKGIPILKEHGKFL